VKKGGEIMSNVLSLQMLSPDVKFGQGREAKQPPLSSAISIVCCTH
jgi:hypothetical protein